eukprot:5519770-Pyramimonas_sp.AAC.1
MLASCGAAISRVLLGHPWTSWGASGPSGRHAERSWSALGALLGPLGGLLSRLEATACVLGALPGVKETPKGPKTGPGPPGL